VEECKPLDVALMNAELDNEVTLGEKAGASTRPLLTSTSAVLVTQTTKHTPQKCSRPAEMLTSVSPWEEVLDASAAAAAAAAKEISAPVAEGLSPPRLDHNSLDGGYIL